MTYEDAVKMFHGMLSVAYGMKAQVPDILHTAYLLCGAGGRHLKRHYPTIDFDGAFVEAERQVRAMFRDKNAN